MLFSDELLFDVFKLCLKYLKKKKKKLCAFLPLYFGHDILNLVCVEWKYSGAEKTIEVKKTLGAKRNLGVEHQ